MEEPTMGDMDDNAAGELIDSVTDAALEAIARILHLNVDSMTEPEYFDLAISCATHILVHFIRRSPDPLRYAKAYAKMIPASVAASLARQSKRERGH
jgi:hypothetical protein